MSWIPLPSTSRGYKLAKTLEDALESDEPLTVGREVIEEQDAVHWKVAANSEAEYEADDTEAGEGRHTGADKAAHAHQDDGAGEHAFATDKVGQRRPADSAQSKTNEDADHEVG